MNEGWCDGAESLISGLLKSHLFPAGILAETIGMTHSVMLYRLDISTVYFYEPLLFQIFFSLEIYKNFGLSLSTIIFKVNSHADNYFHESNSQYEISFLIKIHVKIFYIQVCFRREIRTTICRKNLFIEKNFFCCRLRKSY